VDVKIEDLFFALQTGLLFEIVCFAPDYKRNDRDSSSSPRLKRRGLQGSVPVKPPALQMVVGFAALPSAFLTIEPGWLFLTKR
jgi:hypothetical protein